MRWLGIYLLCLWCAREIDLPPATHALYMHDAMHMRVHINQMAPTLVSCMLSMVSRRKMDFWRPRDTIKLCQAICTTKVIATLSKECASHAAVVKQILDLASRMSGR